MGAWLLPRESSSLFTLPKPVLILLTPTAKQLCVANPDRVALIFAPERAVTILLWWGATISTGGKWTVTTADQQLQFLHSETGPLCQQEWWGSASGTGSAVTVQEVLLERAPK